MMRSPTCSVESEGASIGGVSRIGVEPYSGREAVGFAAETIQVVDQQKLDEIVRRIVEAVEPEKIILFGSAARGETGSHSDVDLLVVAQGGDRWDVAAKVYERLAGVGVPVDAVLVRPTDLERYGNSLGLVYRPALAEGRIVYETA